MSNGAPARVLTDAHTLYRYNALPGLLFHAILVYYLTSFKNALTLRALAAALCLADCLVFPWPMNSLCPTLSDT